MTIDDINKQPVPVIVLYIIIGLSGLLGLFFLKAFVIMKIFNWFFVNLYSLKTINIWIACAFALGLEVFGGNMAVSQLSGGTSEESLAKIGSFLFNLGLIFFSAFILRYFFVIPV